MLQPGRPCAGLAHAGRAHPSERAAAPAGGTCDLLTEWPRHGQHLPHLHVAGPRAAGGCPRRQSCLPLLPSCAAANALPSPAWLRGPARQPHKPSATQAAVEGGPGSQRTCPLRQCTATCHDLCLLPPARRSSRCGPPAATHPRRTLRRQSAPQPPVARTSSESVAEQARIPQLRACLPLRPARAQALQARMAPGAWQVCHAQAQSADRAQMPPAAQRAARGLWMRCHRHHCPVVHRGGVVGGDGAEAADHGTRLPLTR